jgi:ATP-dependent Clp protease ATP-binding subunit ClpA
MAVKKKPITKPEFGTKNLIERLKAGIIGQDAAIEEICPYVDIYQAGLCPPGRPAAIIMLLGKTGTGKTASVEELAYCLHGNKDNMLRIDCGEFQHDHETAKLVGAPPGYLGHKETTPILNQQKLNSISSPSCGLQIVLFDEIEKASPAMTRLMLGILDKATLKLGDNSSVNFENAIIFMTSNLGAEELKKATNPDFGYSAFAPVPATSANKLSAVGTGAAKRRLLPEFMNRIDAVITYKDLTQDDIREILEIELEKLEDMIATNLGDKAFTMIFSDQAKNWLIEEGFSKEYGARHLKRILRKQVLHPAAIAVNKGEVTPGDVIRFTKGDKSKDSLEMKVV